MRSVYSGEKIQRVEAGLAEEAEPCPQDCVKERTGAEPLNLQAKRRQRYERDEPRHLWISRASSSR